MKSVSAKHVIFFANNLLCIVSSTLSVRANAQTAARHVVSLMHTGDISDEKFFRKTNDSDATQFGLLYEKISPHSRSQLLTEPCLV